MRAAFLILTTIFTFYLANAQLHHACSPEEMTIPVIAKKKTFYSYTIENRFTLPDGVRYTNAQLLWLFGGSREFITYTRDKRPPNGCCAIDEFLPDVAAIGADRKLVKQLLRNLDIEDVEKLTSISVGKVRLLHAEEGYTIIQDKAHILGEGVVRRELVITEGGFILRTAGQGNANGDEIKKMFTNQKLMSDWWKQTDSAFFRFAAGYQKLFDINNAKNLNQFGDFNPPARCRISTIRSKGAFKADFVYGKSGRIAAIEVGDSTGITAYRYTYNDTVNLPATRISAGDTAVYVYNESTQLISMELRSLATGKRRVQPTRIFINAGKPGESSWTFPSDFGESHKFTYRPDSSGMVCVHSIYINYESRAVEQDQTRYRLLDKCGNEVLHPYNGTYGISLGPVFDYPVFYFNDLISGGPGGPPARAWKVLQVNEAGYPTQLLTPDGSSWTLSYECL